MFMLERMAENQRIKYPTHILKKEQKSKLQKKKKEKRSEINNIDNQE